MLGLSSSLRGLWSCRGMRSLSCSMCDVIPWSGIEPGLRATGVGILATGPPGKPSLYCFSEIYFPPCHKNEESSLGNLKINKQKRRRRRKGEKKEEKKRKGTRNCIHATPPTKALLAPQPLFLVRTALYTDSMHIYYHSLTTQPCGGFYYLGSYACLL